MRIKMSGAAEARAQSGLFVCVLDLFCFKWTCLSPCFALSRHASFKFFYPPVSRSITLITLKKFSRTDQPFTGVQQQVKKKFMWLLKERHVLGFHGGLSTHCWVTILDGLEDE